MPLTGAAALIGKKLKESTKMYQLFLEFDALTKKASDGKKKTKNKELLEHFMFTEVTEQTDGVWAHVWLKEGLNCPRAAIFRKKFRFGTAWKCLCIIKLKPKEEENNLKKT